MDHSDSIACSFVDYPSGPKRVYKKETSDFHGIVSFDPVKMLQQK